jgi:hypothetical protein
MTESPKVHNPSLKKEFLKISSLKLINSSAKKETRPSVAFKIYLVLKLVKKKFQKKKATPLLSLAFHSVSVTLVMKRSTQC